MTAGAKTTIILSTAAVVLIAAATLAGFYFYLPVLVQDRLLPHLAAKYGLTAEQAQVRRIALTATDIGPVRIKAGARQVFYADTIQLRYDPLSLLRGRAQGLALIGLHLEITVADRGVRIAGIELPSSIPAQTGQGLPAVDPWPARLATALPLALEHIELQNSRVHLALVAPAGARSLDIPLSAKIDTSALDRGLLEAAVLLEPQQSRIECRIRVDGRRNTARLNVSRMQSGLDGFSKLMPVGPDLRMAGDLQAHGRAECQLDPFELTRLELAAQIDSLRIERPGFQATSVTAADGPAVPARLTANLQDNRLQWSLQSVQIAAPLKIDIQSLMGDLAAKGQGLALNLTGTAQIAAQTIAESAHHRAQLTADLPVKLDLAASRQTHDIWDFHAEAVLSGRTPELPVTILPGDTRIFLDRPRFQAHGTIRDRALDAQLQIQAPRVRLQWPEGPAQGRRFSLSGDAVVDWSGSRPVFSGKADARLSELTARLQGMRLSVAQAIAHGRWDPEAGAPATLSGDVRVTGAAAVPDNKRWMVDGVSARLPLLWPYSQNPPSGKLRIDSIRFEGHRLGGIQGALQQRANGLSLVAEHTSKLFPGLSVSITGRWTQGGGTLDFQVPDYRTVEDIDLGRFFHAAKGYRFSGQLGAEGALSFEEAKPRGRVRAWIDDGHLQQANMGLNLNGMAAGVQFDDIFKFHTMPGQRLRIQQAALGRVKASDLEMFFQIMQPGAIRIAQVALNWCGGTISSRAIDLFQAKDTVQATLIGTDLNPAAVLEQFQVARGRAQGTVSGRIPFSWSRGKLRFSKARLASQPGKTGTLQLEQLSAADYLQGGLADGSPQRTQLDIAREALKDYTYDHLELRLNSEAEKLVLNLQLSGRPNRLLPFEYDQQTGAFKRIAGKGRAEFKGIDIDLNFSSPIDEILRYRQVLKGG
jgi:hypothetical protein